VPEPPGVPPEVASFLADNIDSVLELELLLLLRAEPARLWSAADLAQELKIDPAFAAAQLEKFRQRKLLSAAAAAAAAAAADPAEPGVEAAGRTDQTIPAYRYAPESPALDAIVAAVAATYASHRVTMIGLIFSKPTSTLKTFADAFRIRKDKE
jgi:hypothetical protein